MKRVKYSEFSTRRATYSTISELLSRYRCQSVLFVHIVNEFDSNYAAVAWVSSIATAAFSFAGTAMNFERSLVFCMYYVAYKPWWYFDYCCIGSFRDIDEFFKAPRLMLTNASNYRFVWDRKLQISIFIALRYRLGVVLLQYLLSNMYIYVFTSAMSDTTLRT